MTVIIDKKKRKGTMASLLAKTPKEQTKKFDAKKFCGKIKFDKDALLIQKKLRDEWQ